MRKIFILLFFYTSQFSFAQTDFNEYHGSSSNPFSGYLTMIIVLLVIGIIVWILNTFLSIKDDLSPSKDTKNSPNETQESTTLSKFINRGLLFAIIFCILLSFKNPSDSTAYIGAILAGFFVSLLSISGKN